LERWAKNPHVSNAETVVFHAKKDRATNANAHLAHSQAQTHMLTLQLAKEPNFCRRTILRYQ